MRATSVNLVRNQLGAYGKNGRSSVSGHTVAIFGASGFLGRYVCNELGQSGTTCHLGNRGDELEMRHLKVMYDLGQSRFAYYNGRDRESIKDVIRDSDTVINLVGKYYETRTLKPSTSFPYVKYATNYSFDEAHVDIPRTIAEVCTEVGVNQLIHVSSLSASPDSTSAWSRSKFHGEQAVREAFKNPTIIRPSQVFGPEDRLLNWFANNANGLPFIPLPEHEAIISPVHCGDIADAISKCVTNPKAFKGKTFELEGPRDFTYKELAQFVFDITGQDPKILALPTPVLKMIGKGMGMSPNPVFTEDQASLWSEDFCKSDTHSSHSSASPVVKTSGITYNELTSSTPSSSSDAVLGWKDLNLEPAQIERLAFAYLHRFRTGGHFAMNDIEGWHITASLEKTRGGSKAV